jgi:hypothetical protein
MLPALMVSLGTLVWLRLTPRSAPAPL